MRTLLFAAAILSATAGRGYAQTVELEQGIRFSLKPSRMRLTLIEGQSRASLRMVSLGNGPAYDRPSDVQLLVQRQTRPFAPDGLQRVDQDAAFGTTLLSTSPRSRMTRFLVQDTLSLNDNVTATLGWQGIKVSNRNANVTVGASKEPLRARDWFLPHAGVRLRSSLTLGLSVSYDETLRAYGDTGLVGPLGLSRDNFLALRRALRPETRRRLSMSADWVPDPGLKLVLTAYTGKLDDQLSFVRGGYLPLNVGSAALSGGVVSGTHRLSPNLSYSLRYSAFAARTDDGTTLRENSISFEASWAKGPLRATLRAVDSSAPALAAARSPPLRIEAGLDYSAAILRGRPLHFSLRLTDPDRLMSTSFVQDQTPRAFGALDQTPAVMMSAAVNW
ncbi:TonB-dependent receptor domain-containing protein [Sphingobium sp. SCG-1]|uniref:TonB-dependent receptor domain-containing protein n=1 Tax=Sphingobium sp. SCG-1 TaxID=2072936 RepID=UPI00166F7D18|nr:TonB-dependent receptor [Sphingobium sp. SCG-1]